MNISKNGARLKVTTDWQGSAKGGVSVCEDLFTQKGGQMKNPAGAKKEGSSRLDNGSKEKEEGGTSVVQETLWVDGTGKCGHLAE